jgi:hypothetical protein
MEGEHIYVYCETYSKDKLYAHHGIDCGDGTVIHLSPREGIVCHDTMSFFESLSSTKIVHDRRYKECYPPSVVVQRAMDRLSEGGYNLFNNNCEHFAIWCKTGQQVEDIGTAKKDWEIPVVLGFGLCTSSQKAEVGNFFEAVCQEKALQDKLKPPSPANRLLFIDVARTAGYSFSTAALDNYVRFHQFYKEFQTAIEQHQSGIEELSDWLKKWQRHIRLCDQAPLDDHRDTIRRYI